MLFWASMWIVFHWLHRVVCIKHILFSFSFLPPHAFCYITHKIWFLTSASCLSYMYVSIFYHDNNCNNECCLFFLPSAFCSFFFPLIFPFAALPPRFLSMTPGENWVRWHHSFYSFFCPVFFLYFSSVLSCFLSLFISFLLSGVLFPVLSPHLCERSSTLCVFSRSMGNGPQLIQKFSNFSSHKINFRSLITHTTSTISTLDILWGKGVHCNVLHFSVRNYLL